MRIPGASIERRYQWARRIVAWAIVAPDAVSDAEKSAAARWLWYAVRGGERPPPRSRERFNLRKELARHDISQADLAVRLGCTTRSIRHWCLGTRRPSLAVAYAIADMLGRKRRVVANGLGAHR